MRTERINNIWITCDSCGHEEKRKIKFTAIQKKRYCWLETASIECSNCAGTINIDLKTETL